MKILKPIDFWRGQRDKRNRMHIHDNIYNIKYIASMFELHLIGKLQLAMLETTTL